MGENQVYQLFSLDDVNEISKNEIEVYLPIIHRLTKKCSNKIKGFESQLATVKVDTPECEALKEKQEVELKAWSEKIKKLGGLPTSLYQVKFVGDEGVFTWTYPKSVLEHTTIQ